MKRDPQALSASFNVDPAYSCKSLRPSPEGLSLLSPPNEGPAWLYLFGGIPAHLFARMRREAFSTCRNIAHPGEFKSQRLTMYVKRDITLDSIPDNAVVKLYCCGHAVLTVNGSAVFSRTFPSRPDLSEIDIKPFLRTGANEIRAIIHSLGEPAAALLKGGFLESDSGWLASGDAVNWLPPERLPFEGLALFPHQEDLPELELKAKPLGDGLFDFGVETFGRPFIETDANALLSISVGESVEEAQSESLADREQLIPALRREAGRHLCDSYLSLRYLKLKGKGAEHAKVKLKAPLYPATYKGAFACADDSLTSIWMRSAYTLRLCMRWLCVDGLKRDRLPWGGDLYMSGLANSASFHDFQLIRRSLLPLYGEGPESIDVNNIADYTLFWPQVVRDQLMNYGDLELAQRAAPLLDRIINALALRTDSNGFLPSLPNQWVFIDWSEMDKSGACSCIQMLHAMALDACAEIFGFLGDDEKAVRLAKKAGEIRDLCASAFWSEEQGAFIDNIVVGERGSHVSRPPNIFAILSGVASGEKARRIAETILLGDAVKPVGTPYMRAFEGLALIKCGFAKATLDILRDDWGGMVRHGATTFWEGYDKSQDDARKYSFYGRPFGKSLCHAWSAGPAYLLSIALAGAKPLEPGWKRFSVEPSLGGLEWASIAIPCPQGAITLNLEGAEALVSVPAGAALVHAGQEFHGPCETRIPLR